MARTSLCCVLAALVLAAVTDASAGSWNSTMFVNKTVSGAAHGLVFVTSLDYSFGGFNAEIQAVDAATGVTAWTASSFGELEVPVKFYAFDNVPGAVYFVLNNLRPAQLVSYGTQNGTMMWTVADSAVSQMSTLQASADGSLLSIVYGPSNGFTNYALTIDRATGVVLVKAVEVVPPVYPVVCGPAQCLATLKFTNYFNGTYVWDVLLLDSRTGHVSASLRTPQASAPYIWGSGDVLLMSDYSNWQRLNTNTFSVMWTQTVNARLAASTMMVDFLNATTGKPSRAVVNPNSNNAFVLDVDTGALLPSALPYYTCPTGAPAPSSTAYTFELTLSRLATGYLGSLATCSYGNRQLVYIYAVFSVTNMTSPAWWRYTSASSYNAFITLSSDRFLLINQYDTPTTSTADVYQSFIPASQTVWSSPASGLGYGVEPLVGFTTGGMAIVQQNVASPPNSFFLARLA